TLDRRVHGLPAGGWSLAAFDGGLPLLDGQGILELKFRVALPALFKEGGQGLRVDPGPGSEDRRGARWGGGRRRGPGGGGGGDGRWPMPEWLGWLGEQFNKDEGIPLDLLVARLAAAFALGCVVAGIYRLTHRKPHDSRSNLMPMLVLLTVLIAMVTLVI